MKLPYVQVLRALAALLVAVHHAQHEAGLLARATGRSFERVELLPWAAGVDLFFVISGFIMVHASRPLFGRAGAARTFLARRAARIVPLYWAATLLFLVVAFLRPGSVSGSAPDWAEIAASLLFLPWPRPDGTVLPVYSLGWTLNYEVFFYLLFAAVIVLPGRRAVAALLAGIVVLVLAGRLLPLPQPLAFWTGLTLLEFGYGALIGWLFAEGVRLGGAVRALLAICGMALLALDLAQNGVGLHPAFAHGIPAALLVTAAALAPARPTAPAGPLLRLGVALGDASFALYLFHPFVVRGLREVLSSQGVAAAIDPGLFVLAALPIAAGAALLIFRLVERPLTAAARRRLAADAVPERVGPEGSRPRPNA